MIPLIIEPTKIKALREFAEANPIPLSEMYQIKEGQLPCVGDREGYSINLDVGFRLVYSIEEHPRKDGTTTWLRHMSVSLTEPSGTRVPNLQAVKLLCMELNFKSFEECNLNWNGELRYVEVICERD